MQVIKVRNPQDGIPVLLDKISREGVVRASRNGPVIVFPEPVTILYEKPMERVVFWKERDANPFFHLCESLWMLAGRRDVKYVEQFVKRMSTFSDDGKKFHAAYGYRWRKNFKHGSFKGDQLVGIIEALKNNPDDRRQYLGIWDVRKDHAATGLDLPCNVGATFQINADGKLDMVVHNRSNDAMMGALGANVVHFSILQEYVAKGIGVEVGRYWQVSSNMHVYESDFEKFKELVDYAPDPYRTTSHNPYAANVQVTPIVDLNVGLWQSELMNWFKHPSEISRFNSHFFRKVATPMYMAHKAYKNGDWGNAAEVIETQMNPQCDWAVAGLQWLNRRKK